MICNGLVNMQSLGLGGGFLMTIYDKAAGRAYVLNARDRAPLAANSTMYAGKPDHVSSIGTVNHHPPRRSPIPPSLIRNSRSCSLVDGRKYFTKKNYLKFMIIKNGTFVRRTSFSRNFPLTTYKRESFALSS